MNNPLMTITEVANLLRVSQSTVRRYVRLDQIPEPLKVGKAMLWRRGELLAFVGLSAEGSAKSDATC